MGTGGVGKTTLSLSAALVGAQQGLSVAAITVDPSRRLSSLMRIKDGSGQTHSVEWEALPKAVDVFYVDPPQIFDEFVSKNIKPEVYKKLKANGIYRQISKNLRETHNFAALYKMQEVVTMNKYDLVVLDTPPCHQVVDFFESPKRLQKFFSAKPVAEKAGWMNWFQERGLQVAESFLKTMVGGDFVDEMDGFFRSIGDLRAEIHNVSDHFISSLQSPQSKIVLVFPPAKDKLEDAKFLNSEIEKKDFNIHGYVLNRAYIKGLDQSGELGFSQDSVEEKIYHYYRGLRDNSLKVMDSFKEISTADDSFFALIPEINQIIREHKDILLFAQEVEQGWETIT